MYKTYLLENHNTGLLSCDMSLILLHVHHMHNTNQSVIQYVPRVEIGVETGVDTGVVWSAPDGHIRDWSCADKTSQL